MKCSYHPEREAVCTCADCGKAICEFCKTIVNARMCCPDCTEKNYTSPNMIKPETNGKSAGKPAHPYTISRFRWGWIAPVLLLVFVTIFTMRLFSDTGGMFSTVSNSGNLDIDSLYQVASLPVSGWIGPHGETEYEYATCGANCYYVGADGQPIVLVNNPDAKDPTWKELESFLAVDRTDRYSYVEGSFVCADFAEVLHNNAEEAGIRAAWVGLEGINHANNAFYTIDEGLVYIDDTGIRDTEQYRNSACSRDRRAAVSIGSEYTAESVFPCVWGTDWGGMGIVTDIDIRW